MVTGSGSLPALVSRATAVVDGIMTRWSRPRGPSLRAREPAAKVARGPGADCEPSKFRPGRRI